jgi:trehalose 6-phosphate synthase/phosphatase
VTVFKTATGEWTTKKSSGGLVSALSACDDLHMTQVGWAGADIAVEEQPAVRNELLKHCCIPVFLSKDEIELYYNGFSNGVLWPLFHYVSQSSTSGSSESEWRMYEAMNRKIAEAVAEVISHATPGEYLGQEVLVWIHDYHLMLVPRFLRELVPEAKIGWFLHTPFPSVEVFRMLPYRDGILKGVLASNYIGFQVPDYSRHFLSACATLLNLQIGTISSSGLSVDAVPVGGSIVKIDTVPIGIDPAPFIDTSLNNAEVAVRVRQLKEQFGNKKIILGIDRLDYMKGLEHKLQAFEKFLDRYPEWRGECVLVQLAVPSRSEVKDYQRLKKHVHELVGELIGRYGDLMAQTPPVVYLDQSIEFFELVALYRAADVMLVTSIRDGMNLVAFEYVASQEGVYGVLLLSEFTGAMQSLGGGALSINPWNLEETGDTLQKALTMNWPERRARHQFCFDYVSRHTAQRWAETFLCGLQESCAESNGTTAVIPPPFPEEKFMDSWNSLEGRGIVVIDLVNCLVPMQVRRYAHFASMSDGVRTALVHLLRTRPQITFIITSCHKRELMENIFGFFAEEFSSNEPLNLILAPENGCVFMSYSAESTRTWINVYPREDEFNFSSIEWRQALRRVVEFLKDRTPGSYVEETDFSLKWITEGALMNTAATTLRELLLNRWAGPLNESEAEVVLGDDFVDIRAKSSSLSENFARIITHPECMHAFTEGGPISLRLMIGSFAYRDQDFYQTVEDKVVRINAAPSPRQALEGIPRGASDDSAQDPITPRNLLLRRNFSVSSYTPFEFYSVTVTAQAKISKAKFRLGKQTSVGKLLKAMAGSGSAVRGA